MGAARPQQVNFKGTWKPLDANARDFSGLVAGAVAPLPLVRKAYGSWRLLDVSGQDVGSVDLPEPHVHVALAKEEDESGSGDLPALGLSYGYTSEEG